MRFLIKEIAVARHKQRYLKIRALVFNLFRDGLRGFVLGQVPWRKGLVVVLASYRRRSETFYSLECSSLVSR